MDTSSRIEVKRAAELCEFGWRCAEGKTCCSCQVVREIGENVLEISEPSGDTCTYKVKFGGAWFCTCPVRYARYRESGQ